MEVLDIWESFLNLQRLLFPSGVKYRAGKCKFKKMKVFFQAQRYNELTYHIWEGWQACLSLTQKQENLVNTAEYHFVN